MGNLFPSKFPGNFPQNFPKTVLVHTCKSFLFDSCQFRNFFHFRVNWLQHVGVNWSWVQHGRLRGRCPSGSLKTRLSIPRRHCPFPRLSLVSVCGLICDLMEHLRFVVVTRSSWSQADHLSCFSGLRLRDVFMCLSFHFMKGLNLLKPIKVDSAAAALIFLIFINWTVRNKHSVNSLSHSPIKPVRKPAEYLNKKHDGK